MGILRPLRLRVDRKVGGEDYRSSPANHFRTLCERCYAAALPLKDKTSPIYSMKPEPFSINPPYRVFYMLSISFCTASAARSIEVLADVIEHLESVGSGDPLEDIDSHAVLDELQNIIVQGAAVSRYFWPSNTAHEARGRELRQQFQVTEDCPLKSRDLRNMIEHFDEKLDHYFSKGIAGYIIPHYFGPEGTSNGVPEHYFRAYFTDVGVFEILGKRYEIEPITRELWRLNELSSVAAQ